MDLTLDFDDRAYRLGDTIAMSVAMEARGPVKVREASVELVCDQKFAESYTVSGPGAYSGLSQPLSGGRLPPRPDIPSKVGDERIESYAHSRAVFMSGEDLDPGPARQLTVRLPLDAAPPRRWEDAKALEGDAVRSWTFTWRLVVSVDVARGRDARAERPVNIRAR